MILLHWMPNKNRIDLQKRNPSQFQKFERWMGLQETVHIVAKIENVLAFVSWVACVIRVHSFSNGGLQFSLAHCTKHLRSNGSNFHWLVGLRLTLLYLRLTLFGKLVHRMTVQWELKPVLRKKIRMFTSIIQVLEREHASFICFTSVICHKIHLERYHLSSFVEFCWSTSAYGTVESTRILMLS